MTSTGLIALGEFIALAILVYGSWFLAAFI